MRMAFMDDYFVFVLHKRALKPRLIEVSFYPAQMGAKTSAD